MEDGGEDLSALGARVAVVEAPLALYRRYRPETFSEVIGQDHVTVPLRNALSNNRVNHAYLFSGPRGCGKTTSARILARAINCEKGPIAEPCGVCKSCTDLARGGPGSIDVIEIDAASHGGVDDARDLRERAFFAPVESRYKIYIIDEAHMVTTQGFNALLKLVEEPPPHLKFIFATTEPDKVIGTIRSRTHHYPFRLVPPKALADYMATLCESEGVTIEPAALPLVVRAGAGSVRDSLSVLDQLMGGADAEGVTYRLAVQLLGFTPDSLLDACVDGFAAHDSKAVFKTIEKVIETGQDPKRFAEDLLRRLRDLVILSAVPNAVASGLIEAAEDQGERLQTQAAGIGPAELTRAADIVAAGLLEMRGATAPRLQLELICAKVLLPGADDSTNGIQARLDRMERRLTITGGAPGTAPVAGTANFGGAAGGVGPAGTAPGGGYADQPAAGHTGQSGMQAVPSGMAAGQPGVPVGQPAAQAGRDAGQLAAAGQAAAAGQGAASGQAAGFGQGAASGQAAAGGPAGHAGSAPAGGADPAGAAAGGSGQVGGNAGQEQGRGSMSGSAPAAAAAQAAPALVNNTGSRSGAWGDEPTGGSAQGGSGAAAPNVTPAAAAAPSAASASSNVPAQGAGPLAAGTSSGSVGLVDVRRLWPQILEAVKAKRRFAWIMLSQNAQVIAIDEQTLTLGLVNAGARESFARSGSDEILRQAMIDTLGLNRRVEAVVDPSSDPTATAPAAPQSASAPPSSSWDAPATSPNPGNAPGSYAPAGGNAPAGAAPAGSAQAGGNAAGGVGGGAPAGGAAGGASTPAGGAAGGAGAPAGGGAAGGVGGGASAGGATGGSGVAPGGGGQAGDAGASGGSGSNAPTGGHSGPGMGNAASAPNGAGGANASGANGSGANTGGANTGGASAGGASTGGANTSGANAGGAGGPGAGGAANGGVGAGQDFASAAGTANASVGGGAAGGAVATAVRVSENAAGQLGAAGSPTVVVRDAGNEQAGLQADQQAGGPPAPAANPAPATEDRRTQAASKRRAAEAAVAAEQSRRAAQVHVEEAPLTPEEEAEAIGDDDIVLEEDSRSHTDLLAETLGAQIISEEPN
ncbi:DNA polymerase III subunit gamma and tau [Kribbella sp. NPDC023855]|uniref:DNA polymerase III subunit gamma and tau n=1 Tax=Kribbella sp. NPDC023855 TaxID=3154698 RepID=UPI0033C787E1